MDEDINPSGFEIIEKIFSNEIKELEKQIKISSPVKLMKINE